jgi:hypothetical protein
MEFFSEKHLICLAISMKIKSMLNYSTFSVLTSSICIIGAKNFHFW